MSNLGCRLGSDTTTSSSENESLDSDHLHHTATTSRTGSPSQSLPIANLAIDSDSDHPDSDPEPKYRSKWEEEDSLPTLPHKVLKLRRLLFEAIHAALTIISEVHGQSGTKLASGGSIRPKKKGESESVWLDVKEPWMRLSRVVGALRAGLMGGKNILKKISTPVCLRILAHHPVITKCSSNL